MTTGEVLSMTAGSSENDPLDSVLNRKSVDEVGGGGAVGVLTRGDEYPTRGHAHAHLLLAYLDR